ncbi:acetolactate synthase large subunit [Parapusillimonas sp. JC17]|uniref:acetolactate synthase large subunit n=1 Tax=Parapusillimonas sp. JC17 TaxID=3445768 RepID=UPI003F9EE724
MNGAESLVKTLLASEIDVCFANPGTSEMHFVAALDRVAGMRCVLGLFEGVVTGAADGYGRMAGKPATTLLHLGPGLANGIANLHNARKARTPILNIVGEHASDHLQYESPLRSDLPATAALISDWYKVGGQQSIAQDAAEAVTAARSRDGQIATLILPADTAWAPGDEPRVAQAPEPLLQADANAIARTVQAICSGKRVGLLVSGPAVESEGLRLLSRFIGKPNVQLFAQQSNRRFARGRGHLVVPRIPFNIDLAVQMLRDIETLVLVGSHPPAAFFGYPNKPRLLMATDCEVISLLEPGGDTMHALAWLADELGCPAQGQAVAEARRPEMPDTDQLDPDTIMQAMAALLPENAIIVDESVSSGRSLFKFTDGAAPHDFLQITGGAIGSGLPMATGAAVACPDRKVICFEGDGSGMYTLQALWTQAREQLDVVTIILANRSYRILHGELKGVGIDAPGEQAHSMLDLERPALDWVSLARGHGIPAVSVNTVSGFARAFRNACAHEGPFLIEALLP